MLGRRLLSAAIIISVVVFLVWCDYQLGVPEKLGRPGTILALLAIVVAGMAASELVDLLQRESRRLSHWLAVSTVMLMVIVDSARFLWVDYPPFCHVGTLGWGMLGLGVSIGLVFLWELRTYGSEPNGASLDRICRYVFILGYLQVLFAFLIGHRLLASQEGNANQYGLFCIVLLITTVKMSDAMAYFVGKSIGRTKITPVLSPNKTLEGSIGGVLGGIAGAALIFYIIGPQVFQLPNEKSAVFVMLYGVCLALAGMVGDLAESFIKREAQIKDSSSWLPGLGGVLDIADSLVFAAPVSMLLLL